MLQRNKLLIHTHSRQIQCLNKLRKGTFIDIILRGRARAFCTPLVPSPMVWGVWVRGLGDSERVGFRVYGGRQGARMMGARA